jgi:hypothetical protein
MAGNYESGSRARPTLDNAEGTSTISQQVEPSPGIGLPRIARATDDVGQPNKSSFLSPYPAKSSVRAVIQSFALYLWSQEGTEYFQTQFR